MSAGEIAHRAGEQIKRAAWRRYSGAWDGFDAGPGVLPAIPGLRQRLVNTPPELRQRVQSTAQGILDRPIEIFGQRWGRAPLAQALANDPLIFHLDPVSRGHWPAKTYCFDISYRERDGFGDYKFCAELNTLQSCQTLAAAACLTDNREAERIVWVTWNAWYETNPPFQGINWVSGVNIALRVVSLLVTASLLDADSPETHRRMRALLNASGFWLDRYPSLHSSANNHLLAESVALFALGTLCPDLPGSRGYASVGRRRVEQLALRLILPDGIGAEMSPSYAAFAIEWILLAVVIANSAGRPFGPEVLDRLAAAARCFNWLMDCDGNSPSIGDNDNSCVVAPGFVERRYVASIAAAIAGQTAEPALSPVTYDRSLRDLVFSPPAAGVAQSDGIRHFDNGGMSVVREIRQSIQAVLVFDHGPLGYLEIGAHGHADTLAIWLSIGGQPVLVDAGTYLYGGAGPWREYFRATRAHNTVEVCGVSSSTVSGAFNWSQKACGRLTRADDGGDWSIEAEHDGYQASLGRKHVRRLTRTEAGLRVEDRLEGGAAPARIGFLLHPDLSAVVEGCAVHVMRGKEPVVTLASASNWTPQVLMGVEKPPAGWHSARFAVKTPAAQIVFAGEMGEQSIITDIVVHAWAA